MGAALSSQAELTSVSSKDDGKIEFSPLNELLLNNIQKYVETLSTQHPKESKVVFRKPFEWTTGIKPSDMEKEISGKLYEMR